MKKLTATFGLAAAVGLTALSAAPASAAPFANCTEARAAGQVNIPLGDPNYSANLDRDNDGFACDSNGDGQPMPQPTVQPQPPVQPQQNVPGQDVTGQGVTGQQQGWSGQQQVQQMPVGAADTGVTPQAESTAPDTSALVAGGGVALVAVGAGVYGLRRRRNAG